MMRQYLQAENLKYKRTFTKKLIFIAPVSTLLVALLNGQWFQFNGFSYWYTLILQGCIPLMAALINQKEEKKLHYGAVFALPISLKKVWISKVLVMALYIALSCVVLSTGIILGGYQFSTSIPISRSLVATILIVVTVLWQIPLCLFLAKKLGIIVAILINGGVGTISGVLISTKSFWWICPYSWTARLMCPVLGILPSSLLAKSGDPLLNTGVIPIGIILSVALFALLLIVTANWFQQQEVN